MANFKRTLFLSPIAAKDIVMHDPFRDLLAEKYLPPVDGAHGTDDVVSRRLFQYVPLAPALRPRKIC